MIKSNRNQIANASNMYQGTTRKVLCVCSAGLLRSPTAARVLQQAYGYNTRACGISEEYALIPISEALAVWADEIVFMQQGHYRAVKHELVLRGLDDKVVILDVPDDYSYNDEYLQKIIKEQYDEATSGR